MRGDLGDARLKLAEMTRMAFYDYYLASRLAEVNEANRNLLNEFRQLARTQYEASKATQQDVLQADVELAAAESRATELARDRRVAAARINTLLHQPPGSPLLSPPARLATPEVLPAVRGSAGSGRSRAARPVRHACACPGRRGQFGPRLQRVLPGHRRHGQIRRLHARKHPSGDRHADERAAAQLSVRGGGERGRGPRPTAAVGISGPSGRRTVRGAIGPCTGRAGAAGCRPLRGEDSAAQPAERGVGPGELH